MVSWLIALISTPYQNRVAINIRLFIILFVISPRCDALEERLFSSSISDVINDAIADEAW